MTLADQVEDCLSRLGRALERARLYGVGHPEAVVAIDELWPRLSDLIARAAPLTLATGMDGLRFRGQRVSVEDDEHDGLGRRLHREGIATITFGPRLTRQGLERFLDLVRVNLSLPEYEEETLESLLWQAEIEGLAFQAVAALMEAEAISGDAVRYLQEREVDVIEVILGRDRTAPDADVAAIPDDQLARAIEAAGGEARLADDDDDWSGDDAAWHQELMEALQADADVIARERAAVAGEAPADQVARACALLYRVLRARRVELDPAAALSLVEAAIEAAGRQHDPLALVQLIEISRSYRDAETVPAILRRIDAILDAATQPTFIARLVATASPRSDPTVSRKLVAMLDDAAIQALIEWAFTEGGQGDSVERGRWLIGVLGDVAASRAERWLMDPNTPPRLFEPAALLLRGRDTPQDRGLRPRMLAHQSTRVQEIALGWYEETGIPEGEADLLLARLLDRRPRVRRSTWPVLARHVSPAVARWFRQQLQPGNLAERPEELQRDLCVGAAAVLGERALPLLRQILDQRVGFFANRQQARLLQLAAEGIARIGSSAARRVLDEGARGWVGARSQACKQALAKIEGETR